MDNLPEFRIGDAFFTFHQEASADRVRVAARTRRAEHPQVSVFREEWVPLRRKSPVISCQNPVI